MQLIVELNRYPFRCFTDSNLAMCSLNLQKGMPCFLNFFASGILSLSLFFPPEMSSRKAYHSGAHVLGNIASFYSDIIFSFVLRDI